MTAKEAAVKICKELKGMEVLGCYEYDSNNYLFSMSPIPDGGSVLWLFASEFISVAPLQMVENEGVEIILVLLYNFF